MTYNEPMTGKLIFVSGLSGAGKSTLVRAALEAINTIETVVTYVTRPMRAGEESAIEYVFVSDEEYAAHMAQSRTWDETIYAGYKYGADGEKYINDLQSGMNVIVAVAPDMRIIQAMSQKYGVQPTTIWIDTDQATAHERIDSDSERSARDESATIKDQFAIVFEPTGDIDEDSAAFVKMIKDLIKA